MKKVRLDQLVFELGLTESRERAKTTIMSGHVFVNGQRADKPGMPVAPDARVEVHGEALPFVSRGGFKLDKALRVFPVDPAGKHCIDCGACEVVCPARLHIRDLLHGGTALQTTESWRNRSE